MQSENSIESFVSTFPTVKLPVHTLMIEPNERQEEVFYIQSGCIRMFSLSPEGQELTITLFKPGAIVPFFIALEESKNAYYFDAFIPSVVRKIPVSAMTPFIKDNPQVLFEYAKRISRGLRTTVEMMQHQLFGSVRQRVSTTLMMLAKRFGKPKGTHLVIDIPLSHQDIANLVGVTRESVSLEIGKLQEHHVVLTKYKQIEILDSKLLEKWASHEK